MGTGSGVGGRRRLRTTLSDLGVEYVKAAP